VFKSHFPYLLQVRQKILVDDRSGKFQTLDFQPTVLKNQIWQRAECFFHLNIKQ